MRRKIINDYLDFNKFFSKKFNFIRGKLKFK